MHPQAPNTQTFLPACLLPTACDYNGLDCFDPLVDSFTGSKTDTMEKVFGQRTPTATSIHQFNLADHQHEVTEPALIEVHAADFPSYGGPCEGFRDTLEDDRA
jgi:hypothetical protein